MYHVCIRRNVARVILFGAACSVAFSYPAQGDDGRSLILAGRKVYLAFVDKFTIKILDEVSDGCWPKPDAVKNSAELTLRQNGFTPADDRDSFSPTVLIIYGIGYDDGTGCVVHLRISLNQYVVGNIPFTDDDESTLLLVTTDEQGQLMTGPKHDMQQRIRDYAIEAVEAIALNVIMAKEEIFIKRPDLKERQAHAVENYKQQN